MTTTEINFTEEELQKYGYLTSHCRSVENANYEFNRVLTSALKNPKSIRDVVRNIKLITNPEIFMVCDIEREDITLLSDYLRKAITPLGLKEFPAIQPQRFADLIKGSAIGKNDLKLNSLEEIISWYYLANEGYVKKRDEGIQISYDMSLHTNITTFFEIEKLYLIFSQLLSYSNSRFNICVIFYVLQKCCLQLFWHL